MLLARLTHAAADIATRLDPAHPALGFAIVAYLSARGVTDLGYPVSKVVSVGQAGCGGAPTL